MSINTPYSSAKSLPAVLPVFPLAGILLLPRCQLPLNIFEPRYVRMIDDAMATHRLIVMAQPNRRSASDADCPAVMGVGTAGRITQIAETGDGRYHLTLTGVARCGIGREIEGETPYRCFEVDSSAYGHDFVDGFGQEAVNRQGVIDALREFAKTHHLQVDWDSIDAAPNEILVNALSMMAPFGEKERQALLEAADLRARAEVLMAIAQFERAAHVGSDLLQ